LVQKIVKDHIKTNNLNVDAFTTAYNNHSANISKLLLISLVFMFTLPLFLFNIRKNKLFFDHLLASFEFNAFSILINSVLFPIIIFMVINLAKHVFNLDWNFLITDEYFSIFGQAIFIYFLYNLQRRFYKDTMLISGIKSVGLSFCVFYSWKIYRFILFFVTYYTM
jgi:hypothetical protein